MSQPIVAAMKPRRPFLAGLLFCAFAVTQAPAAETVAGLVASVSAANHLGAPLRADVSADIDGVAGKKQDQLVLVERGGEADAPLQLYVELDGGKTRLLVLGTAEFHLATGGKATKIAADAEIGGTSFTAEDFLTFSPARCAAMRLADLAAATFTLVCEPKKPPSQYSLMVYRFDREKSVPLQVLLYKDGMTNLVKMVRNDDFVEVASKWRPTRVVMQDYKLRTRDELRLRWQGAGEVPAGAFDTKSFAATTLPKPPAAKP